MLVFAQANHPCFSTLPSLLLLPKCKTTKDVNQLHAHFTTSGLFTNPSLTYKFIASSLSSSSPLPLIYLARYLFFSQPLLHTHISLWNAVIKSFSHGQHPIEAVAILSLMLQNDVSADRFSLSLALKACSRLSLFKEGLQIQCLIEKTELGSCLFLRNSLICFYSRCGKPRVARILFDRMHERDSVSWNSMIDGYVKHGMIALARELFDSMEFKDRNLISWNSIISGYAQFEDGLENARWLFDQMEERDLVSWNSMIDGYVKWGRLDDAVCLFERMPEWDVISWANLINGYAKKGRVKVARYLFNKMPERDVIVWNVMINGYVQNGHFVEALLLFHEMRTEGKLALDKATLVTALSAAAELGRTDEGILIHEYIDRNGFCLDGKLGVALINMYSKCGSIEKAMQVFENLEQRSVDHWNAMIGGLAIHGLGELALQLFAEMEMLQFKPDDITYIGVLNACSHAGLVEEGLLYFVHMQKVHNLKPKVQHYGCVVDILGRSGHLDEARKVIEEMPLKPNGVVWRALLSACKNHGNFEIGQLAARNLVELDCCSSSSYVLLSNLYAGVGMWGDARKIRVTMKEREIRKVPGCSWIELNGIIHEFVVGDESHPQAKEIYFLLDKMHAVT